MNCGVLCSGSLCGNRGVSSGTLRWLHAPWSLLPLQHCSQPAQPAQPATLGDGETQGTIFFYQTVNDSYSLLHRTSDVVPNRLRKLHRRQCLCVCV